MTSRTRSTLASRACAIVQPLTLATRVGPGLRGASLRGLTPQRALERHGAGWRPSRQDEQSPGLERL